LPALMKHGLVALDVDGTEAVHAAHVVHAVHLLRIMEILPLWPRMWRRVSIAATLILVSACLQSGGRPSFDVCGPALLAGAARTAHASNVDRVTTVAAISENEG